MLVKKHIIIIISIVIFVLFFIENSIHTFIDNLGKDDDEQTKHDKYLYVFYFPSGVEWIHIFTFTSFSIIGGFISEYLIEF